MPQSLTAMYEPRKMLCIQITRKDGTTFLASAGMGESIYIVSLRYRKVAVANKRIMRSHGLNAKVVTVIYTEPLITAH